jgi:hypothetical protein
MTDIQLYFAIGVPVFAIIISMIASMMQVTTINARITSLESAVSARFISFESTVNSRFGGLETRFDTLIGKVVEIDTRLTRVEERLEHR